MATYRVVEQPNDGTTGQYVGEFTLSGLTDRLRRAVESKPNAGRWTLPALSDGDVGEEVADLQVIVTELANDQ